MNRIFIFSALFPGRSPLNYTAHPITGAPDFFYPPQFILLDYILKAAHTLDIEHKKQVVIRKTRQELYEECGITVKTLNRTIKKLKEDGIISTQKGKIAMSLEQFRLGRKKIHHYVDN